MGFPQQTQWTNAPRKPRILCQSVHHHFWRGYMAIYVGFPGGVPVPYVPLNPEKFLVTNIPSYNGRHPTLPPHLLSLVLPPLAQRPPMWARLAHGIDGWMGRESAQNWRKNSYFWSSKNCRFNWNVISYGRGAAKSILERIPIIWNVP